MKKFSYFYFLLVASATFAQEILPEKLKGKVNANNFNLEGVYVINLKNEKAVITDGEGYFAIPAVAGDTLLFSSMQYKAVRLVLKEDDFKNGLLFIKMEPIMNQLDEVIIKTYRNINAVSLGIVPANQKKYTVAERRYATASSSRLNPMGFDPILNLISGRTAMLKKELVVEKKMFYITLLEEMFDENHYVNKLKIPSNYIKGFEYYAVDNDKFTKILDSKNYVTTEFLLGELATKYKEIIACENE